jgi:hypothetical protein
MAKARDSQFRLPFFFPGAPSSARTLPSRVESLLSRSPNQPQPPRKEEHVMTPLRQRMIEDVEIRNFSSNTIATYVFRVAQLAKHFKKSPDILDPEEIQQYQIHLCRERKIAHSTMVQVLCPPLLLQGHAGEPSTYRTHPIPQTGQKASGCAEQRGSFPSRFIAPF